MPGRLRVLWKPGERSRAVLVELLLGFGHALLIGRLIHAVAQLVGVAQNLLLFVAEPLQLAADFLLLLFGLCLIGTTASP